MPQLWRILARPLFLVIYSISCFSHTITTFSEFSEDSKNISEDYFIVTAYYSPLENQEDYITGSYEGDIRLNGSWIRGASGKNVFPWMIAAPKKYSFWTKIYIAWLWTWSVEDRGGAIIEASDGWPSHDRLDVWMWFGDEWRRRAILWWARKVSGYVVENNAPITIEFSKSLSLEILWGVIWPDSDEWDIKRLQEFLISLKMYSWIVDWNHNSIKDTIIEYQLKHNIIRSREDEEAWYFWPKTIALIKKEYPNTLVKLQNKNTQNSWVKMKNTTFESILKKNVYSDANRSDVKELQTLLKHVWIYKWKIDGEYKSVKSSLINYQIKRKIISDNNQTGAGNFWPKTRETIKKEFSQILSKNDTNILNSSQLIIKIPQVNIGPDSKSESIKELQTFMTSLNIYNGVIDWKYDSIKESIIKYQLKNGIIKTKEDEAAWYFWPKTREKMNKEIREIAKK
jgi:hypothetical protein